MPLRIILRINSRNLHNFLLKNKKASSNYVLKRKHPENQFNSFFSFPFSCKLDYPVQSAQCCLDFATNYLRSFDAVHNEYVPRLFLAMAIAVW